jgi:hypothetical protein
MSSSTTKRKSEVGTRNDEGVVTQVE